MQRSIALAILLCTTLACRHAPPSVASTPAPVTPSTPPIAIAAHDAAALPPLAQPSLTEIAGIWLGVELYAWDRRGNVWRWSIDELWNAPLTATHPIAVTGLTGALKVAGACGLFPDRTVHCLRLVGTDSDPASSVVVSGIDGAIDLDGTDETHCAVLPNGSVRCWGNVTFDPLAAHDQASPVDVAGVHDAVQVSVGGANACARLRDGTAMCWGHNEWGELGDGTTADRAGAVAVAGLHGIAQIGAGAVTSCARAIDGTARCWGVGFGPRAMPLDTPPLTAVLANGSTGSNENAAGTAWTRATGLILGLGADGVARLSQCGRTDYDPDEQAPAPAAPLAGASHVRAIAMHAEPESDSFVGTACALSTDAIRCWALQPEPDPPITLSLIATTPRAIAPSDSGAATNCTAHARQPFHLRSQPSRASTGLEVTDVSMPVTVLQRGSVRRGTMVLFRARIAAGNEGWMFLAPEDLDASCDSSLRAPLRGEGVPPPH